MKCKKAHLKKVAFYSNAIANGLREYRLARYEDGTVASYSGDPFRSEHGMPKPVWPKHAMAICMRDGEPALTVVQCIDCGGLPIWRDSHRPDVHDPNDLGLIGFWLLLGHLAASRSSNQLESAAESNGGADKRSIKDQLVDMLVESTIKNGHFVTFTGDEWVIDYVPDTMLDRIDAVIDSLLRSNERSRS